MRYTKPALRRSKLIQKLKDWEIEVLDETEVYHQLEHFEFFKFKSYCFPLRTYFKDKQVRFSHEKIRFSDVIDLYKFDRNLRLLFLDALEMFELSLRSAAVGHLANTYGSVGYVYDVPYKSAQNHEKFLHQLTEAIQRRKKHNDGIFNRFYSKYPDITYPPVWRSVEAMTFGMLVRWLDGMSKHSDRQAIATVYLLHQESFFSLSKTLVSIRNACAHHQPIWNHVFSVPYKLPRKPDLFSESVNRTNTRFLYNSLVGLGYLTTIVNPDCVWRNRLIAVLEEQSVVDLRVLGFPKYWTKLPLWNF